MNTETNTVPQASQGDVRQHFTSLKTGSVGSMSEAANQSDQQDIAPHVGVYANGSTWCFHSYQAQTLLQGRKVVTAPDSGKRYEVPSLNHVGKRLNTMWYCSKSNDPYADAALIEIERLLERANRVLQRYDGLMMKEVKNRTLPNGFSLDINTSTQPMVLTLNDIAYKTPHCKQLVLLIASFDDFVRKLTTYREFGLLTSINSDLYLFRVTRSIRAVFMESMRFNQTGVTRHDVFEDNDVAAKAAEKMGGLPMDILRGERRPLWSPQGVVSVNRHSMG